MASSFGVQTRHDWLARRGAEDVGGAKPVAERYSFEVFRDAMAQGYRRLAQRS